MPVKVRCQSCEKVFAAPDAARGKSVKCPGCQERVKVPGGDGAKSGGPAKGKAPVKKKAAPAEHDHEEFLKNMDLDEVEDTNVKVCPKCGHEAGEEAMECANCGLNFESGLTKEKQRGVDPKIFFRVVVKDSLAFLKKNRSFAIRTSIYTMLYSLACLFFVFMIGWCISFPPRSFWFGLAFVAFMVPFGWVWFLNGEIIKATLEKLEKMPRTNFDMFTCTALGIKLFIWLTAMGTQLVLPLVAGYLVRSGQLIPGLIVGLLGGVVLFLMLPQVMVHMVMPNQARGWLAHVQFQAFGKSFMGCAYWCVLTFGVMIPVAIPVTVMCLVQQAKLATFLRTEMDNFKANSIRGADYAVLRAAMNNPKKGEQLPTIDEKNPLYEQKPLPWTNIIVPSIGLVISQMMFGFAVVFTMRANGVLAFYFKKQMKLDSLARDVVWIDKKKLLEDETPAQKKARKKKEMVMNSVATVAFVGVLGGVAWYMLRPSGPPSVPAGPAVPGAPADGAAPGGPAGGAAPGAMPGGAMPGGAMPGGAMPGGAMPGGAMPGAPAGGAAPPGAAKQ